MHAYRDGDAPGAARLEALGLEHHLFAASGTSEDIAMLMAYELGADLIVAVGTHTSMVDFLDKGRAGMASTVVTRIKVGPILVDAKGVSRLYERRVRKRDLLLLVLAAVFAMAVVIAISEPIRLLIRANWVLLHGVRGSVAPVINFRFHLVSLVAVFLAIGVGVAMGASFLDRATVDTLRSRVDDLSEGYQRRGRENATRSGTNSTEVDSQARDLAGEGSEALADKLNGPAGRADHAGRVLGRRAREHPSRPWPRPTPTFSGAIKVQPASR